MTEHTPDPNNPTPQTEQNTAPDNNPAQPDQAVPPLQSAEGEEINIGALADNVENIVPQAPQDDSAQIIALQTELATAKDQMVRAVAEAENTRKRMQKERQDAGKFAIAGFARDILEVADNLRRALNSLPAELIEAEPQIKNLQEGIEATERTLLKSFEKNQIQPIDAMGQIFDPNVHEVMFEAPDPSKPAGIIIQVLETGYTLNDRLLRPARVGVVKDEGQTGTQPSSPSNPGNTLDQEV